MPKGRKPALEMPAKFWPVLRYQGRDITASASRSRNLKG